MRKIYLILISTQLFFLDFVTAQNLTLCGDQQIINLQKGNNKNFEKETDHLNYIIKNYVRENPTNSNLKSINNPTNYIIPVVFHIVHPFAQAYGTGANISYAQILSQLSALNAAFAKNYSSYNGQSHPSYAQNTNIQFCLATIAMPNSVNFYNGGSGVEYGVMRYADNTNTNHQVSNASASSLKGLTHPTSLHFPFENYLNIWIVSSIGGSGAGTIIGYAPKPLMGYTYPIDGIVMRSDAVGDNTTGNNFSLNFNLEQGKVLAHEVGHYLNLYHIFEGGCAGTNANGATTDACDLNGDMICDTDPCTTQNYNCNLPIPNTCSANYNTGTTSNDMIENYMSYADDDCMNTFTNGQKLRMHAALNLLRSNLFSTTNLANTGIYGSNGCLGTTLYTAINLIGSQCINNTLTISNATLGNTANSYTWTMAGATPSISNSNTASISYTTIGNYWAKLSISDGTITLKDSLLLSIQSCSLNPMKLDRSNWLFGDSCSISFASGNPIPNSLVKVNQTIKCTEMAVSMSDSIGNLLFYSNGVDLWDDNHTKINTTPIFGWDLFPNFNFNNHGSSVYGFKAFKFPKLPNKYVLISTPPFEIRNSSQSNFAKISFIIYDVVTKIITPFQSINTFSINPSSPTDLNEDFCIIPHCNGVDYWLIFSQRAANGIQYNFYSFLFNQNSLSAMAAPVISGPYSNVASRLKSNSVGNRIVTSGNNGFYLYDFNNLSGKVTNETLIPNSISLDSFLPYNINIFSPNDNYLFLFYNGSSGNKIIQQVDANTLAVVNNFTAFPSNAIPNFYSFLEVGPDNNIYYLTNTFQNLGKINNPSTPTLCSIGMPVSFASIPNSSPGLSLVNYIEANKPSETNPILFQNNNCSSFSFSLSPCWGNYSTSWDFGDGSSVSTSSITSHIYINAGTYTVSLILSYNGIPIPAYTKTISVINPSLISIAGPTVICIGSIFMNNYSGPNIPSATYIWSTSNLSISGFNTLPFANVYANNSGIGTITLQLDYGNCTSISTKTIVVDTIPILSLTTSNNIICINDTIILSGYPNGGIYSGANVTSNLFSSSIIGNYNTYYTYTNVNGCSSARALTLTVANCVGIKNNSDEKHYLEIFPNPATDILNVELNPLTFPRVIDYKLKIYNAIGQLIIEKELMLKDNKATINTKELANGVYVLTLLHGAPSLPIQSDRIQTASKRFVIAR